MGEGIQQAVAKVTTIRRAEAPNDERVVEGGRGLRGVDAGHVLQRVLEPEGALFFDDLARDDLNRLRHVANRRIGPGGRGGFLGDIGLGIVVALTDVLHHDLRDLHRLLSGGARHSLRRGFCRRTLNRRSRHDREAGGLLECDAPGARGAIGEACVL